MCGLTQGKTTNWTPVRPVNYCRGTKGNGSLTPSWDYKKHRLIGNGLDIEMPFIVSFSSWMFTSSECCGVFFSFQNDGTTAVHVACMHGPFECLERILRSLSFIFDYSLADNGGNTCLHRLARDFYRSLWRIRVGWPVGGGEGCLPVIVCGSRLLHRLAPDIYRPWWRIRVGWPVWGGDGCLQVIECGGRLLLRLAQDFYRSAVAVWWRIRVGLPV